MVAERDEFRGRTQRAGHVAIRLAGNRRARIAHGGGVDRAHLVLQAVFAQHDPRGPEGVRLQHHGPRVDERAVHGGNDLRCGGVEQLIAPLAPLPGGLGDVHLLESRAAGENNAMVTPIQSG